MKKSRINKIVVGLVFIVSFTSLIVSGYKIVMWQVDNNKISKINKNIEDNIVVVENNDDEEKSILDNYIVNFEELRKINDEIIGYLNVTNTNISSVVVKHNDNEFYLNHDLNKKYNSAGWVYGDYKNKYDGTDQNYVFYAHARKDGSMFGSLKNIFTDKWQNEDNKIIFITEEKRYLFEPFSLYKIKAEDYYITTHFDSNYSEFLQTISNRSQKKYEVNLTSEDTIITLSTCDINDDYRLVLHGKLIEEKF